VMVNSLHSGSSEEKVSGSSEKRLSIMKSTSRGWGGGGCFEGEQGMVWRVQLLCTWDCL
jgi:hypothetical protein